MKHRSLFLLTILALCACDGPPDRSPALDSADPARGRKIVTAIGCTACHRFPDIGFPRGALGPALDGFADQRQIAGRIPNQPGTLLHFIRDAPALVPGTLMPPMPMSDEDARDVTAYLLTLRSE